MNVTVATELVRSERDGRTNSFPGLRPVPAGSDGLLLLPYLEEAHAKHPHGTIDRLGYRAATASPGHRARAAMEGVTLE